MRHNIGVHPMCEPDAGDHEGEGWAVCNQTDRADSRHLSRSAALPSVSVTGEEQSAKPNALVRGWRALVRADDRWQKERRTFPLFRWIIGVILLAITLPGSRAVGTCGMPTLP